MVEFSDEIIKQIKGANNDSQLKTIIEGAIQHLRLRKGDKFNSKRKFFTNMVVALKYISAEDISSKEAENVTRAIEILKSLRDREFTNLF